MVEVLSHKAISLSPKQRKKSNMDLMHLLFRKPLLPQISPFQETRKYVMSYQNSIVLNEKNKAGKNTFFLPTSQSFLTTQDFFGIQDTRCTGSMSRSNGVTVLTQDRKYQFSEWVYMGLLLLNQMCSTGNPNLSSPRLYKKSWGCLHEYFWD